MNDYTINSGENLMSDEKNTGRLDVFIESVNASLSKIEKVLIVGNGKASMVDRVARMEEDIEDLTSLSQENSSNIKELSKSVSELKTMLSTHTKDEKIHTPLGIFLRKEVILYGVVAWILIYSFVPKGINLWELLSKLLGL